MLEIKFRVWDKDTNRMLYQTDIEYYDDMIGFRFDSDIIGKPEDIINMQYTGTWDKNYKEIYDGDVIECDGYLWLVEYQMSCYTIGFALNNIGHQESCVHHEVWDRGEVIGNIYENPELLEVTR